MRRWAASAWLLVGDPDVTLKVYVTVTDAAPKCLGAESPASSCPVAELSRRRVGGAELAAPNRRRRVVLDRPGSLLGKQRHDGCEQFA